VLLYIANLIPLCLLQPVHAGVICVSLQSSQVQFSV